MPKGITRASDRVAVWHEAADKPLIFDYMPDDNEPKDAEYTPDPDGGDLIPDGAGTIVGPPKGKLPAKPPAVVIPNSNKFKTPANGLKKLLDTVDADLDDKDFYGPNAHPKVQDWLDKHPAFTKTYLKPGYQDALKATLGQSNYDKLVYHAPKPSVQALTTHAQQPAPNSNKFKTPANGLSKLLHNPETTPEHVKAWVDKHPGFVSGYLQNPSYQDAVKGAIGEANYKAWADELGIPQTAKPKKTPDQKAQDIADAFAPAGFVPKTQEQFFHDHVPDSGPHHNQYTDPALLEKNQPVQGEMSPADQPDIDAIKQQMPLPEADAKKKIKEGLDELFPGSVSYNHDLPADLEGQKAKLQAWIDMYHGYGNTETTDVLSKLYTEAFGTQPVPTPEDQPDIDAIKSEMGSPVSPTHQKLLDYADSDEAPSYAYSEVFKSPEFKQWIDAKPEVTDPTQALHGFLADQPNKEFVTPTGEIFTGPDQPLSPDDQSEADAIKQQAVAQGILQIFPNADPAIATMAPAQQKKLLEDWATHLVHTPGHQDNLTKLQALYDQHFGAQPPAAEPIPEWEQQLLDQAQAQQAPSHNLGTKAQHVLPDSLGSDLASKLNNMPEEDAKNWLKEMAVKEPSWAPGVAQLLQPSKAAPHIGPDGKLTPEFKAWFAQDNSGADLDDPFYKQQVDMLLNYPENNWTQQKVKGYQHSLGFQPPSQSQKPTFNADQYLADLSTASGFSPDEYAPTWKDPKTAPQELADYLDYLKKFDSNSDLLPKYQAVYNKWFGKQRKPLFDPEAMAQEVAKALGIAKPSLDTWHEGWKSPETAKQLLLDTMDNSLPKAKAKLQAVYDKWFGGDQAAPASATPEELPVWAQIKWEDKAPYWYPAFTMFKDTLPAGTSVDSAMKAWNTLSEDTQSEYYGKVHGLQTLTPVDEDAVETEGATGPTTSPVVDMLQQADPDFWGEGMVADFLALSPGEQQQKLLGYLNADWNYKQKGQPSPYTPEEIKLYQKIINFIDEPGYSSAAPTGGTPESEKSLGEQMHAIDGGFDTAGVDAKSPEEQKKLLEYWLGDSGQINKPQLQALYDKYFGDAAQMTPEKVTSLLQQADSTFWSGEKLKEFLAKPVSEQIADMEDYCSGTYVLPEEETNIYKQIITGLGGQPAAETHGPTDYDGVKAFQEWKQLYPKSTQASAFGSAAAAEKWVMKNLKSPNKNPAQKAKIKAFYDKWFGGGVYEPGFFKPSLKELQGLGLSGASSALGIFNQTPEKFKSNYELVKQKIADGEWNYGPADNWTKIINYIDSKSKGGAPSISPAQPWDADAFQAQYKATFPGSGWDATAHTPEESDAKLLEMVQTKIKNFGYNPTTQKQIDLYKKWFGKDVPPPPGVTPSTYTPPAPPPPPPPLTPDEAYAKLLSSAGDNAEAYSTPEFKAWFMQNPQQHKTWLTDPDLAATAYEEAHLPPPPPPMPFKSQDLNPDDLAYWASNKPKSEVAWKNFSTWWGNTKITPEQETALYQQWFNKPATPEKAGTWFQAMFEHHAEPTNSDLGLAAGLLPNWAHNSWAFGDSAAAEWPVFQQWATKDPGIPAGTKLKQKLAIWKSLSAEEKAAIADNYLPQEPINTKGLLADLQKAFPDSNWKAWGALGQGTLKEKLRGLAETGAYPGLIPVYNKYFNGDIPMPEAAPAADKAEVKKPKQAPLMKLPDWVKDNDGYSAVDGSLFTKPGGEQRFTDFYRFADSIGKGDLALGNEGDPDGYSYPNKLLGVWNQMQPFLKARIKNMPALPWTDVESFKNWFMAQPTLKDEVEAIAPGSTNDYWDVPKSYDYARWNVSATNKSQIEKLIGSTSDPQQKQGLLHLYQKYFGVDKDGNQLPTLAESLKAIEPVPEGIKNATDWDKYLQTTPPDTVAKLIKKKLKDETDPDKFAAWCDIWAQFFPGPPGNKVLSSVLGKGHPGGKALGPSVLGRLYQWKKQGSPDYGLSYWDEDANPSAYVNKIREQRVVGASNLPLYLGWNPPGADDSDYVPDPALFGNTTGQQKSYPAPELETNKNYAQLIDGLKAFAPGVFSAHDLKKLKSDGFQNWFSRSPKAYQESYLDNPDIALDDYDEFIERGGAAYGPALPQGSGKTYDWSSYNLLPQHGDKGIDDKKMPLQLTHNPPRQNYSLEAPIIPNQQGTLPLGVGDRFAPKRAPIPIYRIIPNDVLNLDGEPRRAPRGLSLKQKEFFLQQQRARLRRIDQIINGPLAKRDSKKDREHFEQWAKDHSVTVAEMRKVEDELFSNQPTLDQDEKWKFFQDWCQEHDMPEDAMYGLASKLGIGNPGQAMPGATGSYDHPELGQLILDYVEANGLGTHWTRSPAKAYEGIPAAGASTAAGDRTPVVMVSGWWEGRGEDEGRPGGAFEPDDRSELEHSLRDADDRSTGAPVWVHRVQIRDQNGDWHDLIDPGPISLWPPGRNENVTGKNTKDKPSLAERLDYDLPGVKHDPDEWDTLVPGPATDKKFFQLFKDNGLMVGDTGLLKPDAETAKRNGWEGPVLTPNERELRDRLLKAYRQWFIGQPKLPTKPHYRTASMADSHARTAEGLYSFALRHGVRDPEKYGLPMEAATFRPSAQPRAVAYDAPRRGMEVRKPHGIVTVRERYL